MAAAAAVAVSALHASSTHHFCGWDLQLNRELGHKPDKHLLFLSAHCCDGGLHR